MTEAVSMPTDAAPDQPQPVLTPERIASLDFIRGIAVMGILLANIALFGQPATAAMWPGGFIGGDGDPGGSLWIAQFVLIDGKMRGLFTLLFGAGMMLFMEKAWARGATRTLQARRLGWLFVFGLLHFFLLWQGDILTLYALCGVLALGCLTWQAQTKFVAAAVFYVSGALIWTALFFTFYLAAETPFGQSPQMAEALPGIMKSKALPVADGQVETALMQGGSWFANVGHRLTEHPFDWLTILWQVAWETVPLMLMGMALYSWGLFDGRCDPTKQRLWGWIGVIAGIATTIPLALWAQGRDFGYFSTMFVFIGPSMLTRLPMILGLAALLALWGPKATGWLGRRVAAAGRMAFTNYIGTSFVMLFVFSGWALGLFGALDRPALYLVTVLMWIAMLAWSQPWLARFRYGPLEWLWRCLTYWRLFPLRRR
ncbi:DUF418 domain-containing protein [Pelagerythrobacter sp.]|uniref:DUF418 domain-containing protein n=1 Tax=Pelagerythrobacter sp. TaxID=2800702 RepID=UPI0035B0DF30